MALSPKPDANQVIKLVYDTGLQALKVTPTGDPAALQNVGTIFLDYSSTNVTTAAYVQLSAALSAEVKAIDIFDGSGQVMILAIGAAASEVDQLYVNQGGNGYIYFNAASGVRLSIKAKTATANSGYLVINLFG